MPHEVPQGFWEKIEVYFFEFESLNCLLIADNYGKFPIIRRMGNTITNATIDMMKQIFSEHGVTKTVMSGR